MLELLAGGVEGIWLAMIGVFIVFAAGAQAMGSKIEEALSGITAAQLMSTPVVNIDGSRTLRDAAGEYFKPYRYTAFPVVDAAGRATGLITLAMLERFAHRDAGMTVAQAADSDPALLIHQDDDVAKLLGLPAFARVGRAAVIDEARRPVGLLSVTDVQRALRASGLGSDRHDDRDAGRPAADRERDLHGLGAGR